MGLANASDLPDGTGDSINGIVGSDILTENNKQEAGGPNSLSS
jgi:hypothetical protein